MKSLAYLPYPNGINPTCILSREYTTRQGTHYRAEAYRYNNQPGESIVYTGYRAENGVWVKVPCFTRTEEARYPKRLAKLGTALVEALKVQW
jgi:hypothetical protein